MMPLRCVCVLGLVLSGSGCHRPAAERRVHERPKVSAVPVKKQDIVRIAGQPGFIEAYEQTAMYAKVSGFVKDWNVDIGDVVRQGQVLAELDIPDLVAEYEEKKAEVVLADVNIGVAREMVKVAEKNLDNAIAQVKEARADIGKYVAEVNFRKADYDRIHELYLKDAVAKPADDSAVKAWKSSIASKEAADAAILVAEAKEAARTVDIQKAKVDVEAAIAQSKVAREKRNRLAALVGYTSIVAPYDGIVIARNVVKGDFVGPSGGDLSGPRTNQEQGAFRHTPLYVVARTDTIRIFLDVPEMEAAGVNVGNPAWVSIEAVEGTEIASTVARTSWALSARSRTLRVEIDVPNPQSAVRRRVPVIALGLGVPPGGPLLAASALAASRTEGIIRPNMYAFGRVQIERKGVWAVPMEAVAELGNQTSCYEYRDGKAVLLPIQRGVDGKVANGTTWVEVSKKKVNGQWVPFDGTERVLIGDLSELADGEPVREGS